MPFLWKFPGFQLKSDIAHHLPQLRYTQCRPFLFQRFNALIFKCRVGGTQSFLWMTVDIIGGRVASAKLCVWKFTNSFNRKTFTWAYLVPLRLFSHFVHRRLADSRFRSINLRHRRQRFSFAQLKIQVLDIWKKNYAVVYVPPPWLVAQALHVVYPVDAV
jgi:hypothetical protein